MPALGSALNQPKDVKVDAKGDVYIADIGNSRIREVDTLGIIHTVAGNGKPTDSGDGGPATGAGVAYPWHIAFDSSGDLYIVEYFNHKVRKVDPNGIITTFAGNGTDGFGGDGGPATQAQLLFPLGAAVDGAGNVYIADFGNNRVRRVDASTGTITTIAGNGDPPHIGNSYFGNGYAGDGLRARSASLNGPYGVAVDGSGDIYVADTSNSRVREVDATTGIIHTVARVLYPMGLAVDRRGNLYIAGGVVRKLDSRGVLTTVAGGGNPADGLGDGGPATGAALYATAVALDGLGNMYIADAGNQRIRLVDRKGIITTVAGSGTRGFGGDGGPATAAKLNGPRAVAVDSAGNLYIADAGNNRIRKVDTNGVITTVAGYWIGGQTGDGTTATGTALDFPTGVAVDSAGDLFISDTQNCLVREVDLGTGLTHIVAGVPLAFKTTSPGYFNCDFNGDGGPGNQAHVFGPTGMTVDGNGNLFFVDSFNNRVREIRGAG